MAERVADWRFPFPDSKITGHYGTMSDYRRKHNLQPHSGTDWAMPRGTKIPAIAKGTVRLIQYSRILGWVVVQTAMDKDGVIWYLGYCHMDTKPSYKVGQKLIAGQEIGAVASEGMSSGPHLHATASRKLNGVFGITPDKVDLYKLIRANTKAVSPAAKPRVIYACPHCKKELS